MSRTQLGILAVVAVVATRLVIGWHFYKEGTNKLKEKNWTAAPVLAQAKGDFAQSFKSMTPQRFAALDLLLTDADKEKQRYGKEKRKEIADWRAEMERTYGADFSDFTIEPTLEIWWHEREKLGDYYGFGDPKLEKKIATQRAENRQVVIELRDKRRSAFEKIEKQRQSLLGEDALADASPEARRANDAKKAEIDKLEKDFKTLDKEFRELEKLYHQQEQQILTIRNQHDAANDVVDAWTQQLEVWIASNYEAIHEYVQYKKRVAKNDADPVRQEVATLKGQASTIEGDMKKEAAPLVAGVAEIWDGFGADLNRLAVASQAEKDKYTITRPDQAPKRLGLVNKVIPWFDTIIGVLLILGLFTRPAAIAAAVFLLSVILMQPPWIDGTVPTYYQAVELFALLVLAAVGAGRYAGLDFFLRALYYRIFPPKSADMVRYESQRSVTAQPVNTSEQNAEPITV